MLAVLNFNVIETITEIYYWKGFRIYKFEIKGKIIEKVYRRLLMYYQKL